MKNSLIEEATMPALQNYEPWFEYAEHYAKRVLPSYKGGRSDSDIQLIAMSALADGFEAGSREQRRAEQDS